MRWVIIEKAERGKETVYENAPCGFLTEDGRCLVLASGPGPACVFSREDVLSPAAWKLLRSFAPVHPVRLSAHIGMHFPEVPDTVLCEILGIKADYRGLADAKDVRLLDALSVSLAELYDLPVHVLRLFSRLPERAELAALFEERGVRKNIVREIIQDLYDISPDRRAQVVASMQEFSARWHGQSSVFPAEQLRDIVRQYRYPRSEELRREMRAAVVRMNLPAGIQVQVPADLENGKPVLSIEISSAADMDRLSATLKDEGLRSQIETILSALARKGV